jgi:putative DNA primase/helicase
LQRVSGFIDRHGDGRFSNADTIHDLQIRDRAGWWRGTNGGREYMFTPDGLREATKGIDFKRALDVLQEAKALPPPGANGERAKFTRIAGRGVKYYPIDPDKLAGAEHGA